MGRELGGGGGSTAGPQDAPPPNKTLHPLLPVLTSSSTTPPSNTLATSSWLSRSSRNTEHLQETPTPKLAPAGGPGSPPPRRPLPGVVPPTPGPTHISALLRFRASVMISWSRTETSSAGRGERVREPPARQLPPASSPHSRNERGGSQLRLHRGWAVPAPPPLQGHSRKAWGAQRNGVRTERVHALVHACAHAVQVSQRHSVCSAAASSCVV